MMKKFLAISAFVAVASAVQAASGDTAPCYSNNRAPLLQKPYIELPLGSIRAKGWLLEMLRRQKDGASGQMDTLYPEVMGQRNGWLGGDGDQWERGPYWIDGLLPLAYILDDKELKKKVQPWIEWTLKSQREDGYFGPAKDYGYEPGLQRDNSADWWPRMVVLNRVDQADPEGTKRWAEHFRAKGYAVLESDAKSGVGTAKFAGAVRELLADKLRAYGAEKAAAECGVGVPTLQDIVKELVKPGRDPRDELPAPILRTDVLELKDLKPGMVLSGTVRNVIDFGVFVDIGVHQDGLVHISQVSNKFIKHPSEVVSVGDVVKVAVLDVDQKRGRISLTMKGAK